MVVSLAGCQNVKMVQSDVMASCFNSWSAIAEEWSCFKRALKCSAASFVNDFGWLWSVESVLVWEEGFDAPGALKNNFNINKRVETINTRFKTFSDKFVFETLSGRVFRYTHLRFDNASLLNTILSISLLLLDFFNSCKTCSISVVYSKQLFYT